MRVWGRIRRTSRGKHAGGNLKPPKRLKLFSNKYYHGHAMRGRFFALKLSLITLFRHPILYGGNKFVATNAEDAGTVMD
jgi:hypothetical protein